MAKFFLLCTVLLFSTIVFAQEKETITYLNMRLDTVLSNIEEQFEISISYDSNIVENKIVNISNSPFNLQVLFREIERQHQLMFSKISENNYIVKQIINTNKTTVCGYIKNAKTGQKLEGVSITFKDETIKTDKTGYFKLEDITTTNQIEITLLGYKKRKILIEELNEKKCNEIDLYEYVFNLNEVIVNNYLARGFSKNKDGSINATPSKIGALAGVMEPDVMQSLQLIPGIQSPDETATGINIQGGTPDQNLILWDGIKMYQYDHFFGMLSSFNPYIIDNVKLFKNVALARYGSHLSGVIDITSTNTIPKKLKTGFGTNLIFLDAYAKIPVSEKVGVFVSARRSFSDVIETVTFDKFSEQIFQNTKITDNDRTFNDALSKTNNTYYFADVTAKLIAKLDEKNTLTFSSIFFKNDLDFLAQFDEIQQRTRDQLTIESSGLSAIWNRDWTSRFKTNIKTSLSNYNYDYLGEELQFSLFNTEVAKQNNIKEFAVDVFTEYNFKNNHTFINGYNLVNTDISYLISDTSDVIFNDDFFKTFKQLNTTHTLYNEYVFNNELWQLNAGLRTSYFTNLSSVYLEPRLNVFYNLNSNINLNVSVGQQIQNISQIVEFETQNFGLGNLVWTMASGDSNPILINKQVSLGGHYKKNDLYVDAEIYYKNIENITSITSGFNQEVNEFSIGESNVYGLDVLLKKKINNTSSLISYSITQNDFVFENLNNNSKFYGNNDIRHYLSLIESVTINDALEFSLGWKYRTSRPYTPANGLIGDNGDNITINYGDINSKRLNDYHRLDAAVKYKFSLTNQNIKCTLGLSLLNIYNRKSLLNRTYRINLNTNDATFRLREINKFSLGRTPNLTFRVDF